MGLKDILEANKVPLPSDFDERFNLVMMGLRKDPKFDEELRKFKEQTGGLKLSKMTDRFKSGINSVRDNIQSRVTSVTDKIPATPDTSSSYAPAMELDSEDWMGPRIRWFLGAVTSPYARVMLRSLFMVIFFVSYLESIPVFGNILSVGLDVMVTGGKIITKSIQKQVPFLMGLLPLPYAGLVGLIMAAIYGAMVWPIIAMVSFSRQEFTVAMESFLRAIPPPAGDMIADLFLESNRFVAKMELKRQKLADSIITAIGTVANLIEDVSNRMSNGVSKVTNVSQMKDQFVNRVKSQIPTSFQQTYDSITQPPAYPPPAYPPPAYPPPAYPPPSYPPPAYPPPAVANEPNTLANAFENIKQTAPQGIVNNMKSFSDKIKQSASLPTAPVGQGRKRLTTKRRGSSKWMKTRRAKYGRR
jgi:hypothetical protein